MREPEPPPPVHIPVLAQHTGRGICWADVVADIEKDLNDRETAAVREPEAA